MVAVSQIKEISNPAVYHREYENDLPKKDEIKNKILSQCFRVTQVALPFISLYKPIGKPLSIVLGSTRVISSAAQMLNAISSKDPNAIGKTVLEVAIASTALACSVFAHPLGMIVTTGHDMVVNVTQLIQAVQDQDYKKASEIGLHLTNNALYLGCFFAGSLEWSIASIGMQIFLGLYNSCDEFRKGNYLEAGGHFLMAGIRGKQMHDQIKVLQFQKNFERMLATLKAQQEKTAYKPKKLMLMAVPRKHPTIVASTAIAGVQGNMSDELMNAIVKYGNNSDGIPALLYAAKMGDLKVVKLFIEHGADPFTRDGSQDHFGALHYALLSKNHELIEFFLNQGLNPNERGQYVPVWHEAIKLDDVKSFQLLVQYGLRLDSSYYNENYHGDLQCTPSIVCIQNGSLGLLKYILLSGGDLPRESPHLHLAGSGWDMILNSLSSDWPQGRREEKIECLKWLIRENLFDLQNMKNFQISNTYPEFLEYVIDNGYLQLNEKTFSDYYPIHMVCMSNKTSLLQILIEKGADVNQKAGPNGNGGTALHFALPHNLETMKILLANGADVNALDGIGRTPFYCYLHCNTNLPKNEEIKRLLIEYGAKEKV
ncbi:MAG TPA: ankyrin repeat domain-containing protein [Chlamydiales bacterium]|nr:ankyrin repeat domain-containing protein [Chlamydiales bacterium]